jgi:tRNA(Leu) C34 or U34 (ribose-2'-O)-methylase TrmL
VRTQTRKERYASKNPKLLNASITTVNLLFEENLGFVVRAAACFGIPVVNVIGGLPDETSLRKNSATTSHLIEINQYGSEEEFLSEHFEDHLVAAEICDRSQNIYEYKFPRNSGKTINLIVGHETLGVPGTLLHYVDDVINIPMPGPGFCLNTSQTANIMCYELVRQLS